MKREGCALCPRRCRVDRAEGRGFCGMGQTIRVAKTMLHFWEEPILVGSGGSGAVFFSGCVLKCPFCQNFPISHEGKGRDVSADELEEMILSLAERGAENIDLITPTQYVDGLIPVLRSVKKKINIPIVYNTGGYERVETLRRLAGLVDIYLPDIKYFDPALSSRYGAGADYFEVALSALREMLRQQSANVIEDGVMKSGVLVRHLVLPNGYKDSMALVRRLAEELPEKPLISIMRQYTPCYDAKRFPELDRKLTTFEYRKVVDLCAELGFEGFTQEKGCETMDYTPDFEGF
ncbi:MAG: radical SAM protein [Bacteroides sp.]|nr:radical SAM protein [Eubacterium sp.]MCM1418921.1 radical SAM protein [Roseburia sp.]MCM1461530.1 radical SAM protein [Bacteroides sp.]